MVIILTTINNFWGVWAKYRDLSLASRSIICRTRTLREIIGLPATDKSKYFAKDDFNNCFIIRSQFFWSFNYDKPLSACSGRWSAIFIKERSFNYAWTEYYLQQNTCLSAVMCRSRGDFSAHEKEGKIRWMIIIVGGTSAAAVPHFCTEVILSCVFALCISEFHGHSSPLRGKPWAFDTYTCPHLTIDKFLVSG